MTSASALARRRPPLRARPCPPSPPPRSRPGAARYGEEAAILLLDLDGFKAVNDTHGHLGGDEFAALLPHVGPDEAARVAATLEAALAARPVRFEGTPVTARASIGVAMIDPAVGAERSLREADRAMYEIKGRGGSNGTRHHGGAPGCELLHHPPGNRQAS